MLHVNVLYTVQKINHSFIIYLSKDIDHTNETLLCHTCINENLPFGDLCNDDLEILLSGLTEELFTLYKNCENMTFETVAVYKQINLIMIKK